jgi:Ca2+:H+ antiporter
MQMLARNERIILGATVVATILAGILRYAQVGGLRNSTQRFASETPRMIATLTLLAVAALVVPTLAHALHTPADAHEDALSVACAVVLLVVFIASIPVSLKGSPSAVPARELHVKAWPLWLAWAQLSFMTVSRSGSKGSRWLASMG